MVDSEEKLSFEKLPRMVSLGVKKVMKKPGSSIELGYYNKN